MKYLLDTNVISDYVKGHPNVQARLKQTPPRLLAISSVTRMEIEFGLQLNPERAKKLVPVLEPLLAAITVIDFSEQDGLTTARIRAELRKRGTPIGPYDVQLASTALHHGLIFVTHNTDEFQRVNGLVLENWRDAL